MSPTPEQVRALTDAQIEAADSTWRRHRNAPDYLSGRDAVTRAAGYPTVSALIDGDATLGALARAVRDRTVGNRGNKGLDSSVRWAYLADTYPDSVTPKQARALTAGWASAIALGQTKRWWSWLRVGARR